MKKLGVILMGLVISLVFTFSVKAFGYGNKNKTCLNDEGGYQRNYVDKNNDGFCDNKSLIEYKHSHRRYGHHS